MPVKNGAVTLTKQGSALNVLLLHIIIIIIISIQKVFKKYINPK